MRKRWTAAFLAALFVGVAGADVYGFHQCSHHDRMDLGSRAEHSGAGAPAAGDPSADGQTDPDETGHDESHGFCTCVGTCHAGAASPIPGAGPATPSIGSVASATTVPVGPRSPRARPSPYLLPFANAPPLSSFAS